MSGRLSALLGIGRGDAVAVVGSGGKSTLVDVLAEENRDLHVLVAPTTKIRMPASAVLSGNAAMAHTPQRIQYAGLPSADGQKLCALPPRALAALREKYDLMLMEADGSRGLPCKGWLETEPVVPAYTTCTVGVVPISAIGLAAIEENVLRLPLFLALCGLREGDTITVEALADMVAAPGGMLKNARGNVALFINQTDVPDGLQNARRLAALLRQRETNPIKILVAGSLQNHSWSTL